MKLLKVFAIVGIMLVSVAAATVLVGSAGAQIQQQMPMKMQMPGMPNSNDLVPAALAYAKGQEVYFIHPEASDPGVADVLTKMMGPKVLTVPSLAKVPANLLGDVYVFTNGAKGMGPLGFQPDVFPTVPGDAGYTPLRRINLVTWKDGVTAKVLKSAEEIRAARAKGDISIKSPGVVVNMPILSWPGGKR